MSVNYETPVTPDNHEHDLNPDQLLDYLAFMGKKITESAERAKLMLEIANERGIVTDLSEATESFQPTAQDEQLIRELIAKVGSISSVLHEQGVLVTSEDLEARKRQKSDN